MPKFSVIAETNYSVEAADKAAAVNAISEFASSHPALSASITITDIPTADITAEPEEEETTTETPETPPTSPAPPPSTATSSSPTPPTPTTTEAPPEEPPTRRGR